MTLRAKITEIIKANQEPSEAAWKILLMLDDEGLSIFGNGFLEHDDDYEPGCRYFGITDKVVHEEGPGRAAFDVLSQLEEIGLSLQGNGWLDDDEQALAFFASEDDEGE